MEILTQNIVWGLMMLGFEVTVICALHLSHKSSSNGSGSGNSCNGNSNGDGNGAIDDNGNGNTSGSSSKGRALTFNKCIDESNPLQIRVINVPDEYWKRLDRRSCWEIIAKEAPNMILRDGVDVGSNRLDSGL